VLDLMIEMLIYSRAGVIELLPAVPGTLIKGNIKGILARTYAKVDDMNWNLDSKKIDVTITSLQKQDISLIVRYGIQSVIAPEGVLSGIPEKDADRCVIHLQKDRTVTLHLQIGEHKPSDWISKVASN
jgi:alpha-L-fucosidase 2